MVLGEAHVTIKVTYLERNSQALSCDLCCCGKAISITYSECAFVALVIQHVKSMRRIKLSSVAYPAMPTFPHYLIKARFSGGGFINYKMCFDFLCKLCLKYFSL